jgi:cytochrome c oxidase cbb3-type subunit 4
MDAGTWRGIFTLFMVVAFAGIFLWAYSSRRKSDFDEAANLPLEDDEAIGTGIHSENKIPQNTQQGAEDS